MKLKQLIIFPIVIQLAILVGMVFLAMLPLLTGSAMTLKVEPVDPRSLFRGNYVTFQYAFSNLNLDSIPNDLPRESRLNFGDRVYVEMMEKEGVYVPSGIWQRPPAEQRFLAAVVSYHYSPNISLRCGSEDYFTDPENALAMENELQQLRRDGEGDSLNVTVTLMVDENGKSRIQSVSRPRTDN